MKTFLTIIILSCFLNAFPQSETDLNMDLLSIEFGIWSSEDKKEAADLIVLKAGKLNQNGFFSEAIEELNRVDTCLFSDTNELTYLKSLNTFMLCDYTGSYNRMLGVSDSVKLTNRKYLTLWLFILNENNRWEECRTLMLSACDSSSEFYQDIKNLSVATEFRSPIKASRLSSFFPGLGQIYAGSTFKGVSSFVFVSAFAAVTVLSAVSGLYITGIVYGLIPVFRLYMGGRQYSYLLADKHNNQQVVELKKEYLMKIQLLGLK